MIIKNSILVTHRLISALGHIIRKRPCHHAITLPDNRSAASSSGIVVYATIVPEPMSIPGLLFWINSIFRYVGGEIIPATFEHESGHMLSNAAFGFFQATRVFEGNGLDSFWERIAESNRAPRAAWQRPRDTRIRSSQDPAMGLIYPVCDCGVQTGRKAQMRRGC